MRIFVAASAMCCAIVPAEAAVVTRSYEGSYVFDQGPLASVVVNITLTFDPQGSYNFGSSFLSVSANSSLAAFSVSPISFVVDHGGGLNEVIFSGLPDGTGVSVGSNDLLGFFYIDDQGYATDRFTRLGYSGTGLNDVYVSPNVPGASVIRNVASPIPEPTSWAMMMAGFGLVGATMRRRKAAIRFT